MNTFHSNSYFTKNIIKLAGPIVLVRILFVAINFFGMILISHLGNSELAAGALVTVLLNTVMVISMSPLLGVGIIASRYFGANQHKDIGILIRNASLLSFIISIFVVLILWNMDSFLYLFGEPKVLIPLVRSYLHGMAIGVLPSLLIATGHQLCFSTKKQNVVLIFSIINLIVTLPLSYCLLKGLYGFPKYGMIGWAYGTSLANWLLAGGFFVYFLRSHHFKKYDLYKKSHFFVWREFKNILNIGFPITIQFSGELLAFAFLNLMVGWLGSEELGVQQIILQCAILVLMFPMGGAQAAAILINQSIGQKKPLAAIQISRTALGIVSIIMLIITCVYIFFPHALIRLYVNENVVQPHFIQLAFSVFTIAIFSQFADGIRNVVIGSLRGLQDMWIPMYINLGLLLLALISGYLLGFRWKLGLIGLNIAFMLAFVSGALLMYQRLHKKLKNLTRGA